MLAPSTRDFQASEEPFYLIRLLRIQDIDAETGGPNMRASTFFGQELWHIRNR